jgi:hypothetical protein
MIKLTISCLLDANEKNMTKFFKCVNVMILMFSLFLIVCNGNISPFSYLFEFFFLDLFFILLLLFFFFRKNLHSFILIFIAAWPPRPFVCYSIKDCPEDFCSHPKVLMCKRFICKCS